ncbi:hypothetical protein V1478_005124 [Vespula squamosa]|uniref:Uncharacterized protein n=1 Tax=Vespula squamosa TaxID=30214 RepID=A0ABD2BD90_VESSQ
MFNTLFIVGNSTAATTICFMDDIKNFVTDRTIEKLELKINDKRVINAFVYFEEKPSLLHFSLAPRYSILIQIITPMPPICSLSASHENSIIQYTKQSLTVQFQLQKKNLETVLSFCQRNKE